MKNSIKLVAICVVMWALLISTADAQTARHAYDASDATSLGNPAAGATISQWLDTGTAADRDWLVSGSQITYQTISPGNFVFTDTVRYSGSQVDGDMNTTDFQFGTNNASFEMWLRPDSIGSNELLFETGGGTRGAGLRLNDDGTFRFVARGGNGTNNSVVDSTLTANTADFVQVVGINDVLNDEIRIYINGILDGTTATNRNWDGTDDAGLGIDQNALPSQLTPFSAFGGDIPLFRLYDTALTDEQVLALFDAQVAPVPEPASIAIWSLIGFGLVGFGYYRARRKK